MCIRDRAKGVLSSSAAGAILSTAELEVSNAGAALVIHHSLDPSVAAVSGVLKTLGVSIDRRGSTGESLKVLDSKGALAQAKGVTDFLLIFTPVHVSKVSIGVANRDGESISAQQERNILSALFAELS